jgi:hypothetical protein
VDLKAQGNPQEPPPPPSAVLPVGQDDEVDLCSDELADILADGSISRVKKSKDTGGAAVWKDADEEEAGGEFELTDWV